ncbi:MAG TPA: FIST N-terminal domain-containing protein, partial [Rhodocyclaceae bacterium]|nr:FIST N-terminal domain-containing protein [Rhodocyclaceae bacterium]
MKTAQIVLNGSSVSSSLATLTAIQPHLVFVFADPSWCVGEDRLSPLLQALTPAQLVGCSTAGEVAGHGVQENSCVLT